MEARKYKIPNNFFADLIKSILSRVRQAGTMRIRVRSFRQNIYSAAGKHLESSKLDERIAVCVFFLFHIFLSCVYIYMLCFIYGMIGE